MLNSHGDYRQQTHYAIHPSTLDPYRQQYFQKQKALFWKENLSQQPTAPHRDKLQSLE